SREIAHKQAELNEQRDEYMNLFDHVPCLITVQDRDFRLLRFNREFAERFAPQPGDHCYRAYKGLDAKCPHCQVALTFEDGLPHQGEESGLNKDGSEAHWIFRTSPIRNARGEIVAAMEMSLDITARKLLEEQLARSERKYHQIFNHIPNPVFVLDARTLDIIDYNQSVRTVYGYGAEELIGHSFLELFAEQVTDAYAQQLLQVDVLNQVRHRTKAGVNIFVNIRVSPSEYPGREVLLVTTSDITQRLEAERKLIQAGKMATMGEMATGVAHELNQPLSVIKMASSFFIKKMEKGEPLQDDTLGVMLKKIDGNVDRATRIIDHMRQFARKSDLRLEKVQLNEILGRSFEIFSQQLRLRDIEVKWELDPDLPRIMADAGRLEQVFINLLINARDAIEEKWAGRAPAAGERLITLKTARRDATVVCEVRDTGKGISSALAEKVFELFFTTKEVGKGTGLGLSISYGIIQECGGTIRVEPGPGRGAWFILEFPAADQDNATNDSHRR
ncbi:MAG: PAS domain S-box protein, partial [Desulfobacterales bacterium]